MEQTQDALRQTDWFLMAILLTAGLIYTSGLQSVMDVALYDESNYLSDGVNLVMRGFPAAQDGPLYAAWYYLLSLVDANRIDLYFLNYKLMMEGYTCKNIAGTDRKLIIKNGLLHG